MKAVLIAETTEVIDGYKSFLEENGIDVIVYRWLLKALDNLEEIQPHLVMISVTDFPRHWKTLTQYANSGNDSSFPFVVLIDAGKMASADKVKAEMLGIKAVIDDINSSESQSVLKELISFISPSKTDDSDSALKELKEAVQTADALNDIPHTYEETAEAAEMPEETVAFTDSAPYGESSFAEQTSAFEPAESFNQLKTSDEPATYKMQTAAYEEPSFADEGTAVSADTTDTATSAETDEEDPDKPNWDEPIFTARQEENPEVKVVPISFIYTNPVDKSIVTGKVISYIYPVLFFQPDHKEALNNVRFGQILENCTMKENGNLATIRAQVRGIDTDSIEFCILK